MSKLSTKTSVLHKDIGEHEHKITIYDSYENFAVCELCGMHDYEAEGNGDTSIKAFMKKYPKAKVIDLVNLHF